MSNTTNDQSKIVENYLLKELEVLCFAANLRLEDWDIDKKLWQAITTCQNLDHEIFEYHTHLYDKIWRLAKDLNISVPAKYSWFIK